MSSDFDPLVITFQAAFLLLLILPKVFLWHPFSPISSIFKLSRWHLEVKLLLTRGL